MSASELQMDLVEVARVPFFVAGIVQDAICHQVAGNLQHAGALQVFSVDAFDNLIEASVFEQVQAEMTRRSNIEIAFGKIKRKETHCNVKRDKLELIDMVD